MKHHGDSWDCLSVVVIVTIFIHLKIDCQLITCHDDAKAIPKSPWYFLQNDVCDIYLVEGTVYFLVFGL
jgi:hypothetical protein